MSGDLVPYSKRLLPDRSTSRGLAEIMSAQTLAETHEDALANVAKLRISNGLHLFERSVVGLALVDGLVSRLTTDNPGLEMTLRIMEAEVASGVGEVIRDYIRR